jgi:mitochondrial fission protein ELM1
VTDPAATIAGPRSAWVVTPGSAGHEVQCVGVAEALGLAPRIVRVRPGPPWSWLAPWGPAALDPAVAPPWPDVVVASGRQAVPYARLIRRQSRGASFVAVMQNPVVPPSQFDLVWANGHDNLSGANVVRTLTAPHTLTDARLAEGRAALAARLDACALPRPWIGVVLGGPTAAFRFDEAAADAIGRAAAALAAASGGSVVVTPSRRTGPALLARVAAALADVPAWVWDGSEGENPYFGVLGGADLLVVTCDSVNMLGEAAFTGTPVFGWRLAGGTAKFHDFHAGLVAAGALRWLDPEAIAAQVTQRRLANWSYRRLNATEEIATAIRAAYAAKQARRR